jgi:16S rRNA G966 N2-methylase RsmD
MNSLFDFHEDTTMQLSNILNKRHSTRNMSDAAFEAALPMLAQELEQTSFYFSYTDEDMRKDWKKLCDWTTTEDSINSTSRLGMKLSEHFCPNFYDIESASGTSYKSLWTAKNLEKILRWNRKSHSTPYLSELKRGIYFCCGLTKNTMYRPQMMKLACIKYKAERVLDPCAGWGGRMLGAVSYGAHYTAFEPNTATYNNLMKIVSFLGIQDKVTLICDDARNMSQYNIPKVDLVLTSPPYFDLEVYAHEDTQSIKNLSTYQEWADGFLREVIRLGLEHLNENGVSCWNVGKVKNRDMNEDVLKYHTEFGYQVIDTLAVASSKRQSNQTTTKNAKSSDNTVVYAKKALV